jgi:hypothetical protein
MNKEKEEKGFVLHNARVLLWNESMARQKGWEIRKDGVRLTIIIYD